MQWFFDGLSWQAAIVAIIALVVLFGAAGAHMRIDFLEERISRFEEER